MKKNMIILLMCIMSVMCGCHFGNIDENEYYENIKAASDINYGDTAYHFETDSQNYLRMYSREIAAASEGYYIFSQMDNGNILMYIDKESKEYLPVCSMAECQHNSKDCDAYFGEFISGLVCYEGSLFTELCELDRDTGTWNFSLYRISMDGSVRKKVFDMYSSIGDPVMPEFMIHRGFVYYNVMDGEDSYLYKRGLDSDESSIVYKGGFSDINIFCGYGDGVLLSTVSNNNHRVLYYSNIDDEMYEITDGVNWSFAIEDSYMFCTDNEGLKKINLKNMEIEIITENISGPVEVSADGKYIYIDNLNAVYNENDLSGRKIEIFDLAGKYIDCINLSEQYNMTCFGDENYLFFRFNDSEISILDKSQIGTGIYEWIECKF